MLTRIPRLTLAEHSVIYRVTFTLAAFAIALLIRLWAEPHLPAGFPFLTFFPAIIITAFFAGLRAASVLTLAGGLASWYFFIAPEHSLALNGLSALALAFYAFIAATDIFFIHVMNAALRELQKEQTRSVALAKSRELMFHELQHRVSNNLQVIASLLKLQRRGVSDPQAAAALEVASARVNVVARIQRSLHDPARQQVDFRRFLNEIMSDLLQASGIADRVSYEVNVDPVPVGTDQSVPLALIATEFVSNAIEHGAKSGAPLRIIVSLKAKADGKGVLEVRDTGAGLPEGFDAEQPQSLGLSIARQFAEQIGGQMIIGGHQGTSARVEFPVANPTES